MGSCLPILKYKSGHLSEAISKVSTDNDMSLHERALCVYVYTTKFLWLRVRINVFPLLSEKPFSSQYIDLPILKYQSGHLSEAISKVSTDK